MRWPCTIFRNEYRWVICINAKEGDRKCAYMNPLRVTQSSFVSSCAKWIRMRPLLTWLPPTTACGWASFQIRTLWMSTGMLCLYIHCAEKSWFEYNGLILKSPSSMCVGCVVHRTCIQSKSTGKRSTKQKALCHVQQSHRTPYKFREMQPCERIFIWPTDTEKCHQRYGLF